MGARGIAIIDPATGGNDEVYSTWYECPHCKNDNILNFFKFCPDCGIKLDMSVVEEKRRKDAEEYEMRRLRVELKDTLPDITKLVIE